MKADPRAADNLFNETFRRALNAQALIASLREVADAGFEAAAKTLLIRNTAFLHGLLTEPQYEHLFLVGRQALLDEGFAEKTAALMKTQSLKNARASVDAASLVFAHSYLDANAMDYLRVTALASPDDWTEDLLAKTVSVREVLVSGPDAILEEKLAKRLNDLEYESLLRKVDALFARCRPPSEWSPMDNYEFEADRLRRLDDLRHEIMHGEALGIPIPTIDEDLEYLRRTAWFLMGLVNLRYGLQVDPQVFLGKGGGGASN